VASCVEDAVTATYGLMTTYFDDHTDITTAQNNRIFLNHAAVSPPRTEAAFPSARMFRPECQILPRQLLSI
jgi:hypothetical protein